MGDRGGDTMNGGGGDDTTVWNNGDGSDIMNGDDGVDRVETNLAAAADQASLKMENGRLRFDRLNLVRSTSASAPRCSSSTGSAATTP